MAAAREARQAATRVLQRFLHAEIGAKEMINEWPQHYEDQLLDDVVNVFVEPWYWENLTEKDVAKVAVEAIAREWESEAFFNAVDAMARQKGHER